MAQAHAAQVFGADRTYFVLNGTSTSNKIVTNAILKRGDLVLFDRNNHKSLHQGALVQAGAIPVFLPTARNAFGMIGAVDWEAWDEKYLREQIRANPLVKDKAAGTRRRGRFAWRASSSAPTTGRSTTCARCSSSIGHLCDYVLWDEAWIGYNAFHPLFEDHSPMRLKDLGPEMPGLFSTQSVHKQGAGFSQASADPQARRALARAKAPRRAQALQRVVSAARFDLAVLSVVRIARRQCQDPRRQGRRDAVGPLHRARHRDAQEVARVRPALRADWRATRRRNGSSTRSCPIA